ncbi:MAG TPA: D-2-hydroxyacid dehydrogenase family protein, partial [Stellaceae bacterium]
MRKIAILDDYQRVALDIADWEPVTRQCAVEIFDRSLGTMEQAAASLRDFEIVCAMRERLPFPRALFERLPNLRLLITTGMHNRSIDLDAAAEHGVLVCHTRGGGTEHSTTELTWALILAAARHVPLEDRGMRAGGWQKTVGMTLHGKTLGVLGLGRLGARAAAIGRAFGMEVIAWSPNLTTERAAAGGARLVGKDELFATSDVLTIHMVLGERSRGLVGAKELALLPAHAILVNTSRGPIVDEAALIEALRDQHIGGAGLDVFDQEPLPADHPLRSLDNVVLTPHLGYVSQESYSVF